MDSDSDEDAQLRTDEYGDRFEDYGFVARAEEHRKAGNADFQKQRYERALQEYDGALDQLLTVAYDKSIIVGQRKWNDVVILRSTLHLNKSTCYFKMRSWQKAAEEADACLNGSLREEMMYTDPQLRAKAREAGVGAGGAGASKAPGSSAAGSYVEERLPRALRAKAWFRLSRCNAHLDFLDRARQAFAKARALCGEDEALRAELAQHGERLEVLEKQQRQRQRQQFRGFFDKLQDRGGYLDAETERRARWESLDYASKLQYLEELDDSEGESPRRASGPASKPSVLAEAATDGPMSNIELQRRRDLNLSFEEYLERYASADGTGAAGGAAGGSEGAGDGRPSSSSAAPASSAPAPGASAPGAAGDRAAPAAAERYAAAEVRGQREAEAQRREQAWRERQRERRLTDDLEEGEELRRARERLLQKRRQAPARAVAAG